MSNPSRRVFIIGLDGATFDLIEPWVASGDLPNIARLMQEGSRGRLASTIQPTTAPAWTSFMTGVNQGKHGLFDFIRRKPGSYDIEVTNASHVGAATLFDIASRQHKRVAAINIPYTFPPRPINGISIAGPFIPGISPETVFPADFYAELRSIAPDYFILPDYDSRNPDPLNDYANKMLAEVELRERISLYLLNKEAWDLFMVVFMATDEVQHAFWHCMMASRDDPLSRYRDAILQVYKRADQAIGRIREKIEILYPNQENYLFLLSDHGFGPLKWVINLNRWLSEAGYLTFRPPEKNRWSRLRTRTVKRLVQSYRQNVPPEWRSRIRGKMGPGQFGRLKGELESTLFSSPVDWETTRAYSLGAGGNIFINMKGREPAGIVTPGAEYEQLCQELTQAFANLRAPETGEPLIRHVYRAEEIYNGPYLSSSPDLVIEWKDYTAWGRGRYDSLAPVFTENNALDFTDLPLTGSHRPHGILIAHGQGVRPNTIIQEASLIDLAPTALSLLSIAPPAGMDGRFLSELFILDEAEKILHSPTLESQPTGSGQYEYTPEEAEAIAERLRSLGYL